MTKKKFFQFLATALLLPAGLIFAAVVGVLAITLAVAVYGGLFFLGLRRIVRGTRQLFSGKAAMSGDVPQNSALAEKDLNARDFGRWLQ